MRFLVKIVLLLSWTICAAQERPCDYPEIQYGFIYKPYWQSEEYNRRFFPARIGKLMYYHCNENYVPAQRSSSYWTTFSCTEEGWSPVPECLKEVGKCGPPPSINNGDITSFPLPEYAPESRVEYRCQRLYVLQGSQYVTCRNGFWTKEPTCLEPCTVSKEMMEKNNIKLKWLSAEKLYLKTGQDMEFSCISGYRKDPKSPPLRTKCIEGTINYPR
ncbi:complement factor H-related protein 2 isoform X2 [Notamacropus eugenii]